MQAASTAEHIRNNNRRYRSVTITITIESIITQQQLIWTGYILHMSDMRLPKQEEMYRKTAQMLKMNSN